LLVKSVLQNAFDHRAFDEVLAEFLEFSQDSAVPPRTQDGLGTFETVF
jgi:hypothetical protein